MERNPQTEQFSPKASVRQFQLTLISSCLSPSALLYFTFHSFWTCYAASVPGHMSRNWRKFDQNFNWSPCSDLGSRKIDLPHAAHPWPHIYDMYILRACTCRNFRFAGEWAEIDGRPTRVVIMLIEVLPPDSCSPPQDSCFRIPPEGEDGARLGRKLQCQRAQIAK